MYPTPHPDWEPTHPGELLREDVLPALRMSVAEVAERIGVTRQALHTVVTEKGGVSTEMALRLGKFIGNGPTLWINMQTAHDLWHAERKIAGELANITEAVEPL